MNALHESTRAEERAVERIVLRTFANVTGRDGSPLRWTLMTDTPVGTLGLAVSDAGLADLSFVRDEDRFIAHILDLHGDRPLLHVPHALDEARRQLDRYFTGKRLAFDLEVDLSTVAGFSLKVLKATARIPPGRVLTYTDVARRAGNARASRAAGNALHNNPVAIVVPCHRILRADGSLGGYGGGLPIKQWLLEHEGALEGKPG
jgi:methylated-DNA-[protein]-cysteine S-methyltransferase